MAQGDTQITIVGNVVNDVELRFVPNGAAVANFRVASTPRTYNKNTSQWEDGESMFLTCNVWRQAAENVAESIKKGMRVIVQGRLKARTYQTKDGDNRTVFEVEVDEVGPSLKYATATVEKTPFSGGGNGGGYEQHGGKKESAGGFDNQSDPWNSAPQGGFAPQDENPPF